MTVLRVALVELKRLTSGVLPVLVLIARVLYSAAVRRPCTCTATGMLTAM